MDLGPMVIKLGHDVRDGKFAAGTEWKPSVKDMWHWAAGKDASGKAIDHNAKIIPDDVWTAYLKVWEDVASGKIKASDLIKDQATPAATEAK
jgi:hypothetical protein